MVAGADVDAEGNWWGTDAEAEIDALVLDGRDDPSRGLVDYDPWQGCGDGVCDAGETPCSCPAECGAPPASEVSCSGGQDDDCDGAVDCADTDCAAHAACAVCLPPADPCAVDADCCSGKCRGKGGVRTCR
jgi:hypothetical protein